MPSYSWLQMIRVLDGNEPGDPDSPDTDGRMPPSCRMRSRRLWRMGLRSCWAYRLTVTGMYRSLQRIGSASGSTSFCPPYASRPVPYAIAAILPAAILGEVRDGDGWYDLKVKHPELVKLKAELARASYPQAPGAHGLEEELTLEEVTAESNSVDLMRYRADGVRKHIGFAQQDDR